MHARAPYAPATGAWPSPTAARFLGVVDFGSSVVVRLGAAPPDAVVIAGRAVDLTEALSLRRPTAVELPAHEQWLLGGLTAAFDVRRDQGFPQAVFQEISRWDVENPGVAPSPE